MPPHANADALHIAVATVGRVDYLVTWNLRHLAGAVVRRRIERWLRAHGLEPPTLCTPEELLAALPDTEATDGSDGNDAMLPPDELTPRDDEIVAEVRATRARLAAAVGNDLGRLYEQLKAIEAAERAKGRVVLAPSASVSGEPGAAA